MEIRQTNPGIGVAQQRADAAPEAADTPPDRSTFTAVATATAIVGNKAKTMLIDRPRVLAAFPRARQQERLGRWAVELIAGKPTSEIVPITGGTVKLAGRTLTKNAWAHAYRASNAAGMAVLGVSMIYGIPNLVEGVRDGGGIDGLTETRVGRTGLLATAGNVISLAVLGAAYARTPGGSGRLLRSLQHPLHASTGAVVARSAALVPVTVNELGYLDFLNRGNTSTPWQNARSTTAGYLDMARAMLPGHSADE